MNNNVSHFCFAIVSLPSSSKTINISNVHSRSLRLMYKCINMQICFNWEVELHVKHFARCKLDQFQTGSTHKIRFKWLQAELPSHSHPQFRREFFQNFQVKVKRSNNCKAQSLFWFSVVRVLSSHWVHSSSCLRFNPSRTTSTTNLYVRGFKSHVRGTWQCDLRTRRRETSEPSSSLI